MEKDKGKGTKETECQGHAGHYSAGSFSSPITPAAATACCSSLFIAAPIFLHRRRRSPDVGGPHKLKHCWDTGSRNVTVPLFELQHTPPATSTMRVAKRLPYRLLRLFKLRILPENQFWCAFVETTMPTAGGMPEGASGMVRVAIPTTGSGYAVISGGYIDSAAHLIPEEPVSSGIPNRAWIVNIYIDLASWNDV